MKITILHACQLRYLNFTQIVTKCVRTAIVLKTKCIFKLRNIFFIKRNNINCTYHCIIDSKINIQRSGIAICLRRLIKIACIFINLKQNFASGHLYYLFIFIAKKCNLSNNVNHQRWFVVVSLTYFILCCEEFLQL